MLDTQNISQTCSTSINITWEGESVKIFIYTHTYTLEMESTMICGKHVYFALHVTKPTFSTWCDFFFSAVSLKGLLPVQLPEESIILVLLTPPWCILSSQPYLSDPLWCDTWFNPWLPSHFLPIFVPLAYSSLSSVKAISAWNTFLSSSLWWSFASLPFPLVCRLGVLILMYPRLSSIWSLLAILYSFL